MEALENNGMQWGKKRMIGFSYFKAQKN